MFVASARNVNRNPVTRAAAARVARRERLGRMAAQAREQRLARKAAQVRLAAAARALRRATRLARIERFVEHGRPSADMLMLQLIAERVCRFHGVSPGELRGRRGHAHVVLARQCVCYWARRLTGCSYTKIGRFLGGRSKVTILKAARVYRARASSARAARRQARGGC